MYHSLVQERISVFIDEVTVRRNHMLQSKNKITAAEAAERLHISLSTYYKLRTKYRKELEQWKKQEV